jgi:molybdenum cofactor cytidylyltransferase
MQNIGIIILAAGCSSRMGKPKQLLSVNGQPLLLHVVDHALSTSAQKVMVVLGSQPDMHADLLESYPVDIVINYTWERGIGNSIKAGVRSMINRNNMLDGILLMVSDQPVINYEYLLSLMEKFSESDKTIVASAYSDTLGVPAIFARAHFDQLLGLDDTQGAKALMMQNKSSVHEVDCPQAAIDLDTPEDYHRFQQEFLAR